MSMKIFCDGCENEIGDKKPDRVRRQMQVGGHDVMIEVMVRVDRVWNGGHLCDKCVMKVVTEGVASDDTYVETA